MVLRCSYQSAGLVVALGVFRGRGQRSPACRSVLESEWSECWGDQASSRLSGLSMAPEAVAQCPGKQHQQALARLCSGPLVVYNIVYLQDGPFPRLLP